jgi:uncharacterized membrane protein YedE/YeeE
MLKSGLTMLLAGGVMTNIGIFLAIFLIGIPMIVVGLAMMAGGLITLALIPLHDPTRTREQGQQQGEAFVKTLQDKLPVKLKWLIRI